MFPVDDPTIRLSHYVYGSPILDTSGPGFLAGEPPPGGTVTSDGIPVSATVRILLRGEPGHPSDGMVVREIVSETNGAWMVGNLNPEFRYDAVGRKSGYADVMVSNLKPMRTDLMELVHNTIEENATHNGLDGFVEFVGGLPPYTHSIVGTTPPGLTAVFDRRRLSFTGTTPHVGTWDFDVVFASSNGPTLTVPVSAEITEAPDPHWDSVVAFLRLGQEPGSGAPIDDKGRVWTFSGTGLDYSEAPDGLPALRVNQEATPGSGIQTASSSDFNFADYTVEAFIWPTTAGDIGLLANGSSSWSSPSATFSVEARRHRYVEFGPAVITGNSDVPLNQWSHIAITRQGSWIRMFLNGVIVYQGNYSSGPARFDQNGTWILRAGWYTGYNFNGWLRQWRATKGVARYLDAFTPPSPIRY